MIRHAAELEEHAVLHADVAVVGAGLAGIDVARCLGQQGIRVVLLESGRLEFDPAIQDLARISYIGKRLRSGRQAVDVSTYLPTMYRGYPRIRQFGGTTNVWTGKWRIFDPSDFERRCWIPHSGWPIALDDLLPFHRDAARDYGLGDFDAEAGGAYFRRASSLLAPGGLEPHLFYWENTPTRAGARFFQELKHSNEIDVVLGANATEIVLHENLRTVSEVRSRGLDAREVTVRARHFVLATGGLEAPRLLLASNRQIPAGIGNERDLVGRFYMEHPKHKGARLWPQRTMTRLSDGVKHEPRPRFGISFGLSGDVQRARSLPAHAIFLSSRRRSRLGLRRYYELTLGLEQAPHRDSRVYLGTERDALGMPRLVVDWRFTPWDHTAFETLQRSLVQAFRTAGLGTLDVGPRLLTLDDTIDAAHPMGTTRMAADPSQGVVDADCRVFGTDNLYIASSAVFPTGHAYSPTYTILALARRLGHHLRAACR